MLIAQVQPAFTHDLYFGVPPVWPDGSEPEVCLLRYGEFVSRGGFTWDNPPSEDCWRIHWIEAGQGHVQINGGPRQLLEAGSVFVMRPGVGYYRDEVENKPWRYRWVMLRGSRVAEALKWARLKPDQVMARPGLVGQMEPLFERMRLVMARENPSLMAMCELGWGCLHAMGDSLTSPTQKETSSALPPRSKMVRLENNRAGLAVEWLRQHYSKGATVEEAAAALGLSRSGLFRIFRSHTGQSPKNYLDHLRIEHALHLLDQGAYSVKEMAARSGFGDARHFSRAFKRAKGVGPLSWLKQKNTQAKKDKMLNNRTK